MPHALAGGVCQLKNVDELKSNYLKDYPRTRYDLQLVYPEDKNSWTLVDEFYEGFQSETKEIIPEDKSLTTGVFKGRLQIVPDPEAEKTISRSIAKVAFHYFLYHYPEYTGHESMFDHIKDFIYNGNGNPIEFIRLAKDIEMENLVYDTTEHRHYFRFFVKNGCIGGVVDFFTGLLVGPFSYNVILAGDPDNTEPRCNCIKYVPFSVHPKSPVKKRIMPVSELGLIYEPHWKEILWFSQCIR